MYDLWSRPVLKYSPTCAYPIEEAVDTLNTLSDLEVSPSLNEATWIITVAVFGVQLIYMVVNTVVFCCTRREETLCYKVHTIIYSSIFLVLATLVLIFVSLNFGFNLPKFTTLV